LTLRLKWGPLAWRTWCTSAGLSGKRQLASPPYVAAALHCIGASCKDQGLLLVSFNIVRPDRPCLAILADACRQWGVSVPHKSISIDLSHTPIRVLLIVGRSIGHDGGHCTLFRDNDSCIMHRIPVALYIAEERDPTEGFSLAFAYHRSPSTRTRISHLFLLFTPLLPTTSIILKVYRLK
jgi:hypothetical protein